MFIKIKITKFQEISMVERIEESTKTPLQGEEEKKEAPPLPKPGNALAELDASIAAFKRKADEM